jgi:hypothetical protein
MSRLIITPTLRVDDFRLGVSTYISWTIDLRRMNHAFRSQILNHKHSQVRRCRMIVFVGGMREHCNMIHGWFIKVRLQRCQFGEGAVGNWPLASRQIPNAPASTPHTWLRAFESIKTASQCSTRSTHADLALFAFSHCGSGPFGERGGTAATRPAMHFNASLVNTTRRARSLTKPRNKSLMMEGFYSPHYGLLEAFTAGRHNSNFSSWLVDTMRPIPADQ